MSEWTSDELAALSRFARPVCRQCGPGYRVGDPGCRHEPPTSPPRSPLRSAVEGALEQAADEIEAELVCGCIEEYDAAKAVVRPKGVHEMCWWAYCSARLVRSHAALAAADAAGSDGEGEA